MTKEQMAALIYAILIGNHSGVVGDGLAKEYKDKADYLAEVYFHGDKNG